MVYNHSKFDGMADNSFENADAGRMKKDSDNVWEHPWTTEEIRKNSGNWTLAGDVGLLNHLREFSHKLISRTHEMENAIDSLVHTSKVTCAKVSNVINDFQMLSNLQFVENRVYDEEAKSPEPEPVLEQPKTKEQREAEMMPRIVQAVKLGMSVLDTAFEKLDVEETSESEDEEDISQGKTILVPKDLYEHRPLPYIIGSEQFQRDDYAGLHSLYEEDISSDVSTQDENISASAESEDESLESDFEDQDFQRHPTIVTEHKETKSSVDTLQNKFSDSEGSDLFNADEDEKEVNGYDSEPQVVEQPEVVEKPKLNPQTSLMEELMRKQKGPAASLPDSNKPETIQTSAPAKPVETRDSGDLFASSDSYLEDEDSPFRKKSLFSSEGLFGKESKSESSLFDDVESDYVKPVPVKEEPKQNVAKTQVLPKKEAPVNKRSKSPSLFGEDEDSEHDLFSSMSVPAAAATKSSSQVAAHKQERNKVLPTLPAQPEKKTVSQATKTLTKKPTSSSLFGDDSDDNDLFSDSPKTTTKKVDLGALNDKEDEDDDLFSTISSSKSHKQGTKILEEDTPPKSEKDSYSSLFEESDSFDLFKPTAVKPQSKSQAIESSKVPVLKPVSQKAEKSSHPSLFEDSGTFDLFKPTAEKPQPKSQTAESTKVLDGGVAPKPEKDSSLSLFEESDSFDLFKPNVGKSQPKPQSIEKSKPSPKAASPLAKPKKEASLFEESDSFDFFPAPKEDTKKPDVVAKGPHPETLATAQSKPEPVNVAKVSDDSVGTPSGFNEPVIHSNMLNVINKDRVKIQTKRRKPTRKGRQSRISTDEEANITPNRTETEDGTDSFIAPTPVLKASTPAMKTPDFISETPVESVSKPKSAFNKNEQSKKNLMSQLVSEAAAFKIKKKPALELDEDEDLFADKKSESKSPEEDFSLVSPTSSSDILVKDSHESDGPKGGESSVLSGSTSDDDLFSGPAFNDFRSSVSDRNSIFDDDDIFKPSKGKEGSRLSTDDISLDDDDDIFANVEKEKYEMFPHQQYDGDEDDDDDIFSNVGKPSQSKLPQEKKATNKKEPKKENIDLFSDPLGGLSLND